MNTTRRNELEPRSTTASRSSGCMLASVMAAAAVTRQLLRARALGPVHRVIGGHERLLGARRAFVDQDPAEARARVQDALAEVDRAHREQVRQPFGHEGEAGLVHV